MTDTRAETIARFKLLCDTLRFACDKNLEMTVRADDVEIASRVLAILATEAAPSEPLDDKLVYIKPLRTLVRVQTMYADQVRDLCNAPAAPSEPVADDVCRLVIAARIVAFEDQSADALRELDKASEAFADRVKWNDEPPAQPDTRPDWKQDKDETTRIKPKPDTTKSGSEG